VPGAVSAWVALHKRFGRPPFQTVFEPAIGYAHRGFLVSPVVAQIWARQVATLRRYREFARVFLRRAPRFRRGADYLAPRRGRLRRAESSLRRAGCGILSAVKPAYAIAASAAGVARASRHARRLSR
jgi:gamma-glutamyltranspeptidase/glutathione hydrolase